MKTLTKKSVAVLLAAASFLGLSAQTTIASWDFENASVSPSVGTGTVSGIGGVTTEDKIDKGIDAGHTTAAGVLEADLETAGYKVDGYYAYDVTGFPEQGTNEKTAGIQIDVSTAGYEDITVSVDMRHGNKCANTIVLQYTTDGSTWLDAVTFDKASISDDTWFLRSYDFSSISDVDDNSSFAVRVVSAFDVDSAKYVMSGQDDTKTYDPAKGYRFDNIVVSGTAITTAVDEAITADWTLVGTTLSFGETTTADIEVYNMSGLKVATYAPASFVDLNLASGMYIVKVADSVKKVIIK